MEETRVRYDHDYHCGNDHDLVHVFHDDNYDDDYDDDHDLADHFQGKI